MLRVSEYRRFQWLGLAVCALSVLATVPGLLRDKAGDLIADESGDLYGTTPSGGSKSGGVIFELKPSGAQ
jgi:uncharacterized repeat protein (TIGR03803 family)